MDTDTSTLGRDDIDQASQGTRSAWRRLCQDFNDLVGEARDGLGSLKDKAHLGDRADSARRGMSDTAHYVGDMVSEKGALAGRSVSRASSDLAGYVQRRPVTSVLVAAAVGVAVFMVFRSRRAHV